MSDLDGESLTCPVCRFFESDAETRAYRQGFVDGAQERERIQIVLDASRGRMMWSYGAWLDKLNFWLVWGPASWTAPPWPDFDEG